MQQVADLHERDVIRRWRWRIRQRDAAFCQTGFDGVGHGCGSVAILIGKLAAGRPGEKTGSAFAQGPVEIVGKRIDQVGQRCPVLRANEGFDGHAGHQRQAVKQRHVFGPGNDFDPIE